MLSKTVERHRSGVYKITNLVNSKIYVGSSVNVYNRKHTHASKLNSNTHTSRHLLSAYRKYGKDNFLFEVLEYCDNITEREQYYIDLLKPQYNKRITAQNNIGLPVPAKQRKMISTTLKKLYQEGMVTYKQQHNWKIVEQYSMTGEFIQDFEYPRQAEEKLDLSKDAVLKGCRHDSYFRAGYQWKYKDSDKEILKLNVTNYFGELITTVIKVIDLSKNTFELFPGIVSCVKTLKLGKQTVNRGLKDGSVRKGIYVFSYYLPRDKPGELLENP